MNETRVTLCSRNVLGVWNRLRKKKIRPCVVLSPFPFLTSSIHTDAYAIFYALFSVFYPLLLSHKPIHISYMHIYQYGRGSTHFIFIHTNTFFKQRCRRRCTLRKIYLGLAPTSVITFGLNEKKHMEWISEWAREKEREKEKIVSLCQWTSTHSATTKQLLNRANNSKYVRHILFCN